MACGTGSVATLEALGVPLCTGQKEHSQVPVWFSSPVESGCEAPWENWETAQLVHQQMLLSSLEVSSAATDAGEVGELQWTPSRRQSLEKPLWLHLTAPLKGMVLFLLLRGPRQ